MNLVGRFSQIERAARRLIPLGCRRSTSFKPAREPDLDGVFSTLIQQRVGGLVITYTVCCICSRPLVAHHDRWRRLEFPVAIGGAADMEGRVAQPGTGANDPYRTDAGSKLGSSQVDDCGVHAGGPGVIANRKRNRHRF
jgi:hypothetical protein